MRKTVQWWLLGLVVFGVAAGLGARPHRGAEAQVATETYSVNTVDDADDGACDISNCSLREAISAANAHPNGALPDEIRFDIPGAGVVRITVASELPMITDVLIVDGLTQAGAMCTPLNILVELAGAPASPPNRGVFLGQGSAGSTIRGLAIGGFGVGIQTNGANVTIACNNIGTDASGLVPAGNAQEGIWLQAPGAVVENNAIANNGSHGVVVNATSGKISRNSIYDNGGQGISNGSIGSGNVSRLEPVEGGLTSLRLNTGPGAVTAPAGEVIPFTYELFSSPSCDPSGFGEGVTYLMSLPTTARSDVNGGRVVFGPANVDLSGIPVGHVLTATLTNDLTGQTSGFMQCAVPGFRIISVLPGAEFAADGTVPIIISGTGFVPGMEAGLFFNDPGQAHLNTSPPPRIAVTDITPTSARAILTDQMVGFVTVGLHRPAAAGGGSTISSFHIWPRLTGVSPGAATAGDADTVITITGSRFVVAAPGVAKSRVRINGVALPGANVDVQSATTIVATIPASFLLDIATLQVTVLTPFVLPPAPSNVLPFFVTSLSTPVESADARTASVAELVTVAATSGEQSATASTNEGTGTVAVANYGSAPALPGTVFQATDAYFDVYVSPSSTFTSVAVTFCDAAGGDVLFWFDGSVWDSVSPPATVDLAGCLNFTATATSSPTIAQLSGTPFAPAVDTTPSTISISTPVAGAWYGKGAVVNASYSCSDEVGGSGVASCAGSVVSGFPIDTGTIGARTFVVTATDYAGNVATTVVTYNVGGKDECKNGGWARFLAPVFRNQGQCVSSFVP